MDRESDSTREQEAVRSRRGKWSRSGVPQRGWVCVEEYDAGPDESDFETCGMCESAQVRFIHVMENDRYEDRLNCGCICAANMSGDFQGAERREKTMRSRAGRRDHFPRRTGWKLSAKGTPHIKVNGFHLMVAKKRDGRFQVGATAPGKSEPQWGPKRYETVEQAQRGCFDAMIILGGD